MSSKAKKKAVRVGDRVVISRGVNEGQVGVVRYVGATQFASGKWIGVALSEEKGKNDGTVEGHSYFSCPPKHGLFVKPTMIRPYTDSSSSSRRGVSRASSKSSLKSSSRPGSGSKASSSSSSSRPGSGSKASSSSSSSSSASRSKRGSVVAKSASSSSSSSKPRSATVAGSGLKKKKLVSPSSGLRSKPSRSSSTSSKDKVAPNTRPRSAAKVTTSASSSASSTPKSSRLASRTKSALSTPKSTGKAKPEPEEEDDDDDDFIPFEDDVPKVARKESSKTSVTLSTPSSSSGSSRLPSVAESSVPKSASSGTGITLSPPKKNNLDARRSSLARKMEFHKSLKMTGGAITQTEEMKALGEAEKEIAALKSTNKTLTLTVEQLRAQETKASARIEELLQKTKQQADQIEELELDKTIAEEDLEVVKADMEELKAELDVAQEELAQAKSRNDESQAAMIQALPADQAEAARIVAQNQSLTEALRKLRDVAVAEKQRFQTSETQYEKKIIALEQRIKELSEARSKLENAEDEVNELKEALDDAQGFEEMVESMTDKNLELEKKIEEQQKQIKYLEQLNRAAEDVEEEHLELEEQLQTDLDNKEAEVNELNRQLKVLRVKVKDLEKTNMQFRGKVQVLEQTAQQLAQSKQSSDSQATQVMSQAREVLDRAMKQQQQLGDVRARVVEAGLAMLQADEAQAQLKYLQAYIPDNVKVDKDTMEALSLARRLERKAVQCALLMDDMHGVDAAVVDLVGGEALSMHVYKFTATLMDVASVLHKLMRNYRRSVDSDSFRRNHEVAVSRRSMIEPVESTLDDLLNVLSQDKLSLETPLKPLEDAVAVITKYVLTFYPEDDEAEATKLANGPQTSGAVFHSVRKLQFRHRAERLQVRIIADVVASVKPSPSDIDSTADGDADDADERKRKDEAVAELNAIGDQLRVLKNKFEDAQIGSQSSADQFVRRCTLLCDPKHGRTLPFNMTSVTGESLQQLHDAAGQAAEAVGKLCMSVKSKALELQQTDIGSDTLQRKMQLALALKEMLEEHVPSLVAIYQSTAETRKEMLRVLESHVESLDDALGTAEHRELENDTYTVWGRYAAKVRQELHEASALEANLIRERDRVKEKNRELVAGKKQIAELVTNVKQLQNQLRLMQKQEKTSGQDREQLKTLTEQVSEYKMALATMEKDMEKDKKRLKKLKAELKAKNEQRPSSKRTHSKGAASLGTAADFGLNPEAANLEVVVLARTVRTLRHQIVELRNRHLREQLQRDLPPLPSLREHKVRLPTPLASDAIAQAACHTRRMRMLSQPLVSLRNELALKQQKAKAKNSGGHKEEKEKEKEKEKEDPSKVEGVQATFARIMSGQVKRVTSELRRLRTQPLLVDVTVDKATNKLAQHAEKNVKEDDVTRELLSEVRHTALRSAGQQWLTRQQEQQKLLQQSADLRDKVQTYMSSATAGHRTGQALKTLSSPFPPEDSLHDHRLMGRISVGSGRNGNGGVVRRLLVAPNDLNELHSFLLQ